VAAEPEDEVHRTLMQYDFGQATANMMLAATDIGIGSAHAAVRDQEQARLVLGFPDSYRCLYLMVLGWPVERPLRPIKNPDRRRLDEVTHWGRW